MIDGQPRLTDRFFMIFFIVYTYVYVVIGVIIYLYIIIIEFTNISIII